MYRRGEVKAVLAATSTAHRVAKAAPRLWPVMYNGFEAGKSVSAASSLLLAEA
ncbi:hypothetical protein D3C75_1213210 [compost metagenome]